MMWATGLRSEDKHTLRPALQERGLQRKGRDRRLQGLSERQQLGGEEWRVVSVKLAVFVSLC